MSTIRIELIKKKFSPWGLFRDPIQRGASRPVPIIWLTEDKSVVEIALEDLNPSEIEKIKFSSQIGILSVTGMTIPTLPLAAVVVPTPVEEPDPIKLMTEVMAVIKEEDAFIEEQKRPVYPLIDVILSKKVLEIKKELKGLTQQDVPLSFYTSMRDAEEAGKNRKTIISLLLDIIQMKVSTTGVDVLFDRRAGRSSLADAYHALIEESIDDGEDIDS